MHILKAYTVVTLVLLASLISACGGSSGGGGGAAPGGPGEIPKKPADPLPADLYEKVVSSGVPADAALVAFTNYEDHRGDITNDNYLSVIDFRIHSSDARLFVINIRTGAVDKIHVAHGTGSDPGNDGVPEYFSNVPNSKRSSLGAYLVSEKYYGKYGAAMRTDGLDVQNSNVRERNIVIHGSKYVEAGRGKQGLSWGCPAVPFSWITKLIERLRDGSFLYAVGNNKLNAMMDMQEAERALLDPTFQWLDESEDAPFEGE